jgi:hypothetical protein
VIQLQLSEIAVVVISLVTSSAVAFAVFLAKAHLGKIEESLHTIAEHTTRLAVLDTRMAQTEESVKEIRTGVGKLLARSS